MTIQEKLDFIEKAFASLESIPVSAGEKALEILDREAEG